jgi:hypothetical protein
MEYCTREHDVSMSMRLQGEEGRVVRMGDAFTRSVFDLCSEPYSSYVSVQ